MPSVDNTDLPHVETLCDVDHGLLVVLALQRDLAQGKEGLAQLGLQPGHLLGGLHHLQRKKMW